MASFKNMEMAPIVASHPHIFVKHGFFDLFTRVYYRPTLAEVDCIRNYYTVSSGNAIHQFLLKFQNAPTCAEHTQLKWTLTPTEITVWSCVWQEMAVFVQSNFSAMLSWSMCLSPK